MDNTTIQKFLDEHDYDIRKTHNGRWIDQKCTMDVVCLVSDCIVEYTSNREDKRFTVNDIWYSDYTVENVQQIFSKPNPTQKASNEYDKYFGQPIKLLDAAGVIHGEKSGRGYTYSIVNQELLEYISFRERNSFNFLCLYIEKVLKDSGLYRIDKRNNIKPYFSLVRDYEIDKGYIYSSCFSVPEFSEEESKLRQILLKKGFQPANSNIQPKLYGCGAVSPNSILVV